VLRPKKVAALPVGAGEERKQTNEIGMALPLLAALDIAGKTITADALLTQRKIAEYVVARGAHYVFIAKDNQPTLAADIRLHFAARGEPDFREPLSLAHGRLESRAIWTSTALNDYLDFPHVGQVFVIERQRIDKKTGKASTEVVYGLTDHSPESASPERLLAFNRDHWGIEAHHYILDWNWDEDRCRLRSGHGPENITRLRRFAVGLIKANSDDSVAATIAKLARRVRRVFDYFLMTDNAKLRASRSAAHGS
jgi:predicted transposase YbfD/YdcC